MTKSLLPARWIRSAGSEVRGLGRSATREWLGALMCLNKEYQNEQAQGPA